MNVCLPPAATVRAVRAAAGNPEYAMVDVSVLAALYDVPLITIV